VGRVVEEVAGAELVTAVRRVVSAMVLPRPERVAEAAPFHGGLRSGAAMVVRELALVAHARPGRQNCLRLANAVLMMLPPPVCDARVLHAQECLHATDPHDAFFRIARSADDDLAAYLRGLAQAMAVFVDESPGPRDWQAYGCLAQGLAELIDSAASGAVGPSTVMAQAATPPPPAPLMSTDDPVRRWLRGHQLFATLTQGLIRTLAHLATGNADVQRQVLQRLARLYGLSAVAFRLTADFEHDVYTEVIRPAMCRPHVPEGFSGTLSTDHAALVRRLVQSRPVLEEAAALHPHEHAAMRTALAAMYDDHKWVCARFTGAEAPSLRMRTTDTDVPAVEMLDRFKARRLSMLH